MPQRKEVERSGASERVNSEKLRRVDRRVVDVDVRLLVRLGPSPGSTRAFRASLPALSTLRAPPTLQSTPHGAFITRTTPYGWLYIAIAIQVNAMSTKTALKAAKAAIGAKDWAEAKNQATAVLEKDPQNYFAYLFLGRANDGLSRFDEAAKAYYDATKIKPEDPQAWLGLRSMYEGLKGAKVDENIDVGLELAQIYMNLCVSHIQVQRLKH